MSVVQQVISDARKLATKLTEHDKSMDHLLSRTQGVIKQVEYMKEYCDEMNELNTSVSSHPRIALIHSIQQENRHIRELQKENKELRMALEEHQNIMELIMSKYRQQIVKLIAAKGNGASSLTIEEQERRIGELVERVSEMAAVMRQATLLNEGEFAEQQQLITRLVTENRGLREMLQIAMKSGSVNGTTSIDADTQTDKADTQSSEDQIQRSLGCESPESQFDCSTDSSHSDSECGFNHLDSPNKHMNNFFTEQPPPS